MSNPALRAEPVRCHYASIPFLYWVLPNAGRPFWKVEGFYLVGGYGVNGWLFSSSFLFSLSFSFVFCFFFGFPSFFLSVGPPLTLFSLIQIIYLDAEAIVYRRAPAVQKCARCRAPNKHRHSTGTSMQWMHTLPYLSYLVW